MRAFIVRPFGKRKTTGKEPFEIDFDRVQKELIEPALTHHAIEGGPTLELLYQNNIRIDMFQRLVTAEIVIADLSIHNANVFYELGIRHALRDRHTFLLRCKGDDVPFDLRTDRYLEYDHENPAAALPTLIEALRQTLRSELKDSPVFQLLPELEPEDPARFLVVPRDFTEEVDRAAAAREKGDLELLAEEAAGFPWEAPGVRLVGRAQYAARAMEGARGSFEALLKHKQDDLEANTKLGTIYQRLARAAAAERDRMDLFARSDQALRRVLALRGVSSYDRAEAYSLLASNEKVRWRADYGRANDGTRRLEALRSAHLDASRSLYESAFEQDCNHFYSGLNALALVTVQLELAEARPDVWSEAFDDDAAAAAELTNRKQVRDQLAASVEWSVRARESRAAREEEADPWIAISKADLRLLVSNRPSAVAGAYRTALASAKPLEVDAVSQQFALYEELGVLTENVSAARAVVDALPSQKAQLDSPPRVLLFTGHRIDKPGRTTKRFPANQEDTARAAIERAVQDKLAVSAGNAIGIGGGASGGDILFHEVCRALNVRSHLYLAVPPDIYQVESVQDGGADWVARFRTLTRALPCRVLQQQIQLPVWLDGKKDYSVWQRNNLWTLHNALALGGGANVTLIALWDGETSGDGPGGTVDMVNKARARGATFLHLDTRTLFDS